MCSIHYDAVLVVVLAVMTCYADEYRCPDKCVEASMVCDGYYDCQNNEDEDFNFCGITAIIIITRLNPFARS